MRILILAPGKPVSSDSPAFSPESVIEGFDIFGNKYFFSKLELVNNYLTIEAIRNCCPGSEIIVRHMVNRNNPLHLIKAARQTQKWCSENNIDLVHQFWGGPGAWATSSFMKQPYLLSLLGSDLFGAYTSSGKKSAKGRMLSFFSKMAANRSTRVVVMSQKMKEALPKTVQSKAVIIPEGIRTDQFFEMEKAACRGRLGWNLNVSYILFFDNGNRVKNAVLAHEVFDRVKHHIPGAVLFVAQGIPHKELIYYYNAADLLLMTSLHEGSNNSLKEALACNCPIVSTNVGDAAERLKGVEPSAVVDGFDAITIANEVVSIIQKEKRSNGAMFAHNVSTESIGSQLAELYRQVLHAEAKSK